MKAWTLLFLFSLAPTGTQAAESLTLSGIVHPTFGISVESVGNGFQIRNQGNALAFFQLAARDGARRQAAWLKNQQAMPLRTDLVEGNGQPTQIRIFAP